jgi:hypothetical protein
MLIRYFAHLRSAMWHNCRRRRDFCRFSRWYQPTIRHQQLLNSLRSVNALRSPRTSVRQCHKASSFCLCFSRQTRGDGETFMRCNVLCGGMQWRVNEKKKMKWRSCNCTKWRYLNPIFDSTAAHNSCWICSNFCPHRPTNRLLIQLIAARLIARLRPDEVDCKLSRAVNGERSLKALSKSLSVSANKTSLWGERDGERWREKPPDGL